MSDKLIESTERMFDSFERLVMRGVEMETEIADLKRQLSQARAAAFAEVIEWCEGRKTHWGYVYVDSLKAKFGGKP